MNNQSQMTHCVLADVLYDTHLLNRSRFSHRSYLLTLKKVQKRVAKEGISFYTKTLPRLGKAFDRALTGYKFDCTGFRKKPGTEFPLFLGEFFELVFGPDGVVLPNACSEAIRTIRQALMLFYKLELPYEQIQEDTVINNFVANDAGLPESDECCYKGDELPLQAVTQVARKILARVFCNFDPQSLDNVPRHGPGSVATGEQAWEKMEFKRFYTGLNSVFNYSEWFHLSPTHLCDELHRLQNMEVLSTGTAKVVLVPKDSRGPRLISCEPLEYQWIQQAVAGGIVRCLESHPLTRGRVNFRDQEVNRVAALESSKTQAFATLDMKDASDLVSLSLVKSLMPEKLFSALLAARTTATTLPCGRVVALKKFAPMGSALCFPVESVIFWAILVADRMVRLNETLKKACSSVLVFGDDIIVPCSDANEAIMRLECFHLKVNHSKSCLTGFFRESCGVDAYRGVNVTPLRIKKIWRHQRDPGTLDSWISYANSLYSRGYRVTACNIARSLADLYGPLPRAIDFEPSVPSLRFDPIGVPEPRRRFQPMPKCPKKPYYALMQQYVWYPVTSVQKTEVDRWSELFRSVINRAPQVRAGVYTIPRRSMLRRGWRNTVK